MNTSNSAQATSMCEGAILQCMEVYSFWASQHCLNSHPKNFGLQKAAQINEVTAVLKWQVHVENLNIFVSIYLCPPDKSKAVKKVCSLAKHPIIVKANIY